MWHWVLGYRYRGSGGPIVVHRESFDKISFWLVTVLQSSFVDTGFTQDKNKKDECVLVVYQGAGSVYSCQVTV